MPAWCLDFNINFSAIEADVLSIKSAAVLIWSHFLFNISLITLRKFHSIEAVYIYSRKKETILSSRCRLKLKQKNKIVIVISNMFNFCANKCESQKKVLPRLKSDADILLEKKVIPLPMKPLYTVR